MSKQNNLIMAELELCLKDKTLTKQEIYTKVVDKLEVPRPTVRRVARDLRTKYHNKIVQLQV